MLGRRERACVALGEAAELPSDGAAPCASPSSRHPVGPAGCILAILTGVCCLVLTPTCVSLVPGDGGSFPRADGPPACPLCRCVCYFGPLLVLVGRFVLLWLSFRVLCAFWGTVFCHSWFCVWLFCFTFSKYVLPACGFSHDLELVLHGADVPSCPRYMHSRETRTVQVLTL